jgi:hypothetical protein
MWDMAGEGWGGIGLLASEMKDAQVHALNGWTGDPNWTIDNGKDSPRLAWEEKPGRPMPAPDMNWLGGSGTAHHASTFLREPADQS